MNQQLVLELGLAKDKIHRQAEKPEQVAVDKVDKFFRRVSQHYGDFLDSTLRTHSVLGLGSRVKGSSI